MSLFGKKKEVKSDVNVQDIKNAVDVKKIETQQTPAENIQKSPVEMLLEENPLDNRPPVPNLPIPPIQQNIQEKQFVNVKEMEIPPIKDSEKAPSAPLFVKIDKYRHFLNSVGNLKTAVIIIKNSLLTLSELDKARDETFRLVQDAVDRLEKKLISLDQELVRPSGYHDFSENLEYHDVEAIEATVADLKGQIEQLKSELETVS